ncbi:MAG: carbohydrate ABC transporter permease [Paenibacillaceae bacterium]
MIGNSARFNNLATHLCLIIAVICLIVPFLWMLSGAFKDTLEAVEIPPHFLPSKYNFDNFKEIAKYFPIYKFLWNSVFVSVTTTVLQVLVCAMSAFVFAKIRFRGNNALFLIYLITMMIPFQVTMTPLFVIFQKLHLLDSYWGLILPGIFSAYGTFLMRQHMLTIPNALLESAFIDGASYFSVFRRIMLPLSKPALATLSIFSFMGVWNNFLWPLIIINSKDLMTLPLGLSMLKGRFSTVWNLLMAGNVISFIPIFIVFLFAQRYFIRGITMSGIK